MISTASDLLAEQIGHVTSIIFLMVMLWLGFIQIEFWIRNPKLISEKKHIRYGLFTSAGLAFVILLLFLTFTWELQWWTLAVAIALGFSLALIGLNSALAFLVTLLLLRPFEISTVDPIINSLPRAALLMVGTMFITRSLRERSLKIFWSLECTLLLLFVLWLLFSGTQSSDPIRAKNAFVDTIAKGAVLFLLICNVLRNHFDVRLFKNILVASAFGVILSAIFYNVILLQADATGRLSYIGLLGDPNDITAFAILALPFALSPLWESRKKWYAQLFAITFLVSTLFMIYLAQSRGAILALISLCIAVVVFKTKRKKLALSAALVIATLYIPMQSLLKREAGDLNESGANRLVYWKTALNMAAQHPLMGVGFNDYPNRYEEYLTAEIESESGKRTAHSSWFLVLAENGLIGFFLFLALYLRTLVSSLKIRKTHPEYMFSLIAYGVTMSFLSHAYLVFPYLLFAFTLISSDILSNKDNI
ncbi:MAG: O-antigen ligase family protein [Bdellovibrionaceae bacterium]|nr:O-antigen ligase family protein [Bdellovibrio sp.]